MDSKTFFDNFETIASAPGGIVRLRELILDLAVQGKLVTQRESDSRASALIEKIEAERKIVFTKCPEEQREKPHNWETVCLGDLCHIEMGQSPDSDSYNQSGKGLPFYQGKTDFGAFSPTPRYWCSRPTKRALPGDVLLSVRAPVGPTNFLTEESCIGRGLAALRPLGGMETDFLLWWLRAYEKKIAKMGTGTTFIAVSKKNLLWFPVSLPPLAEQKRIVAKVDELMTLCDELEAMQNRRDSIRTAARKSAIDSISTATTPDELSAAWTRISNNWTTIADTPESISSLRSMIIGLAFKGKIMRPLEEAEHSQEKVIDLGSVITLEYGKPLDKALRSGTGQIPVYGANGVKTRTEKPLVNKRGIVVGRKGSAGEVNITDGPFWPLDVTFYAKYKEDVFDLEYLYYLLKSLELPKMARGIKPGINRNDVNALKIRSVDLEEQKRVVAKVNELMALCDQIEFVLINQTELAKKIAGSLASEVAA